MSRQREASGSQRKKEVDVILTRESDTSKLDWIEPMPLYAQEGAIVASLTECLDITPVRRSDVPLVSVSVIGGVMIGIGLLWFGYQIGYAAGMLNPWYELRGWAFLLLFAVMGTTGMLVYGNRRS